ncbi:MAG: archaemetzincin family Zn-dependent metalloprotease [Ignavibacteria bacterium]|jgi:archaemetzincin|nr:archaemetzincin family Zn-dependent metalloprotease [Ignavibacteria bacterium]MDH7527942.1 archaemetzincin family Zn-dependent metalloprotease [Ignavibacteria bacterium]NPV11803.1 archaemetzincin family Zn-dependent metalloprotease [Ignavibacteria bacterium]
MDQAALILLNFNAVSLYDKITNNLKQHFNLNSRTIIPDIDLRKFYSEERDQYYSTKLIEYALLNYSEFKKILMITDFDLYVPVLTFVFGEAQLNGKAAIVSAHRLYPEFYGLPPNDELFISRLIKEINHELGHTYGLRHCFNFECVMHSSSNVDEIDIKSENFCNKCLEKLNLF